MFVTTIVMLLLGQLDRDMLGMTTEVRRAIGGAAMVKQPARASASGAPHAATSRPPGNGAAAGGRQAARRLTPRPWTTWLAWVCWALCVALLLAAGSVSSTPSETWFIVLVLLCNPSVGALLAARRPANAIGWLFCGLGLAWSVTLFSQAYFEHGYPWRTFTGWEWLFLVGQLVWAPAILVTLTFVLLLFPDGRLLSPRWRPLAWASALVIGLVTVRGAFLPTTISDDPVIRNPAYIQSLAALHESAVVTRIMGVGGTLLPAIIIGSVISLVLRLRRARGVERQQLKWFAYVGVMLTAGMLLLGLLSAGVARVLGQDANWAGAVIWTIGPLLAIVGLPLTVGIAILRHRLYDIDRLINRTLVYATLTAGLGLLYVGGVVALQPLLGQFTAGSDLAVAGSTLAVAALFRPLQNRVQRLVNRRFYRRTYDASKTVDRFVARLRDEIDLDTLTADMLGVVRETMQPAHVSLWLRAAAPRSG